MIAPAPAILARRPRWARAATSLIPPVVAWLAANVLYWAAADRGGYDYLLVRTHARWDSGNYLNIARRGYALTHCAPTATSPFTTADWCGTAGWFPLYPLGMRLVGALGLGQPRAGLLLAELFALGSLGLLWWLLGSIPRPTWPAWPWPRCSPAACTNTPSSRSRWPSPPDCCTWPCWRLAAGRPPGSPGLRRPPPTSPASCSSPWRPSGCCWNTADSGSTRRAHSARTVHVSALVLVGVLAVMGLQQAETGRWNGFLLVEAKYGTGLHNPATTFVNTVVRQAPPPGASGQSLAGQPAPRDQFRLVTIIVPVAVAATLTAGEQTPLELAVLLYTALFWLAPLVAGGHLAQYRMHALLTPSVLLPRRLPAAVAGILALLSALVAWQMAGLFHHYILI